MSRSYTAVEIRHGRDDELIEGVDYVAVHRRAIEPFGGIDLSQNALGDHHI